MTIRVNHESTTNHLKNLENKRDKTKHTKKIGLSILGKKKSNTGDTITPNLKLYYKARVAMDVWRLHKSQSYNKIKQIGDLEVSPHRRSVQTPEGK